MPGLVLPLMALAFVILYSYCRSAESSKRPPGPFSYPFIGNLLAFPLSYPWKYFLNMKEHADLIYYHGLGNSLLVLNSLEAINDLLVHKGDVYCGRPAFTVACDLMQMIKSTALLPFGPRWKLHRKLARAALSPSRILQYNHTLSDITNKLLEALHQDPDAFEDHMRIAGGRVLLGIMYGLDTRSAEEEYIGLARSVMLVVAKALMPVAFLVDLIPPLKYLPKWTPFLTFHKLGAEGKAVIADVMQRPFDHVKRDMKSNHARPSFILDVLQDDAFRHMRDTTENFESELQWASGTMFVAGQELISATMMKIIWAMATHSDQLRRAQTELENFIGSRPPVVKDRDNCPYVHSIIKEAMRYQISAPFSIIRASTQDDWYRGFFIPKNTIVIPNIWAIAYAPNEEFPPETFAPERFLQETPVVDPSTYHFGFGKRGCPGQVLAENAIFLFTANILKSFDFGPKLDDDGQMIPINVEYPSGVVSLPSSFQCELKPRTDN